MKNREFHTATLVLLSALWLASCGGNQGSAGIALIEPFNSQLFSSLVRLSPTSPLKPRAEAAAASFA